ncbi:MAG: hypothetical protein M3380_18475 [Chloroflexota bacterium]|jgi:hypothetical protein|nr:hypothetical protein [Chloroflexota bacterium]
MKTLEGTKIMIPDAVSETKTRNVEEWLQRQLAQHEAWKQAIAACTKRAPVRQETGPFADVPPQYRPYLKARFDVRVRQLLSPMEVKHYATTGSLPTASQARIENDYIIKSILEEVARHERLGGK